MYCVVTDIIDINTKKSRVVLDCDIQFSLYKGEIRRFHISEGAELEESVFVQIMSEILPKRARERCLNLLASKNMTEYELRNKLLQGFYPVSIIDSTIERLLQHKLIDDKDYAITYIESHQKVKSQKQMVQYLTNKGISRELLSDIFRDMNVDEEESIRILMNKKRIDTKTATKKDINKFCMYLMRKGYNYELIRKVVL